MYTKRFKEKKFNLSYPLTWYTANAAATRIMTASVFSILNVFAGDKYSVI